MTTTKRIFELEKKNSYGVWVREGLYGSYKSAQDAFIHRAGNFRIIEHEVKE